MTNKPICKAPFIALRYSADGYMVPCCWMKTIPYLKKNSTTIESYWENKTIKKIRQQMLDGVLPDGCKRCTNVDDTINYSRIEFYDRILDKDLDNYSVDQPLGLYQIDLNFSNKCNLKCRHCGPWNSTAWVKDYKQLQQLEPHFKNFNYKINTDSTDLIHQKKYFKNIKRLDFKGGEPMMQDEMYILLDNLIKWDYAKNIHLVYITNGTKPYDHLKDQWNKFKSIGIGLSFEATGDLFSYVRGGEGFTWKQFNENLKGYTKINNLQYLSLTHSIMNFTLFDLPQQVEFIIDTYHRYNLKPKATVHNHFFDNVVTNPAFLDPVILHKDIKLKLIKLYEKYNYKSIEPIKNRLISTLEDDHEKQWKLFKSYTKSLDKIRNTNLIDHVPEFEDYLE